MTLCLLLLAHPLSDGLNDRHVATAVAQAKAAGRPQVARRDLCADGFDPHLTAADIERLQRRLTCPD